MTPASFATQVTCANITGSCELNMLRTARVHAGLCVGLPWPAGFCGVTSRFLGSPVDRHGNEERGGVV